MYIRAIAIKKMKCQTNQNQTESQTLRPAPQTTTVFEHVTEDGGLIYTMGILVLVHMLAYVMQDPCTC